MVKWGNKMCEIDAMDVKMCFAHSNSEKKERFGNVNDFWSHKHMCVYIVNTFE